MKHGIYAHVAHVHMLTSLFETLDIFNMYIVSYYLIFSLISTLEQEKFKRLGTTGLNTEKLSLVKSETI